MGGYTERDMRFQFRSGLSLGALIGAQVINIMYLVLYYCGVFQ